jgi:hypothetical protein
MMAATTLGLTRADRVVLLVGGPAVGLVVGLVVPHLAEWSSDHVPLFRGPLKLITSWDSSWSTVVFAGLGVALGIAFAVTAFVETLAMTLTDHELQLRKKRITTTVSRGAVTAAFLDGKQLVLLGQQSEELFRDTHDSTSAKIGGAFREHGWPWTDADPHAEGYRRWVPDLPDLHPAVNALLAARARAVETNDAAEADELRSEVARLGYVVRDEQKRQYWRTVSLPQDGSTTGS